MASGGRKIPSLSAIYEEEYLENSWSKRYPTSSQEMSPTAHIRTGEQPLEYQDTAAVPDMSAEDLSNHLQSEELYVDTSPKHNQLCQYGYHDNKLNEPADDDCLQEHSDEYPECTTNTVGTGQSVYPRNDHSLYVLEDRLRHKVNVSIEDFRAHIQEVFYEQFDLYRHPDHEAPGTITNNHAVDMERSCDSVCTSHSSIDSGVSGVDNEEHSVNLCLIKLQTCAAVITSSLQRAEYAVT